MTTTGYAVRRWHRYGHDRLYVSAPDGTNLGWYDLLTGRHDCAPDRDDALRDAVRHWLATHEAPATAADAGDTPPARRRPGSPRRPWRGHRRKVRR